MEKGIGHITAPLVKALSADGHRVCWRVDLQNHSLAPAAQHFQRPPAIALPPQLGEGAEMLHINKCLGLPAQHQPHPQISVVDEKVLILRRPQNIQLGALFPLFMERETPVIQGARPGIPGVCAVSQTNQLHTIAPFWLWSIIPQFSPDSNREVEGETKTRGRERKMRFCLVFFGKASYNQTENSALWGKSEAQRRTP